MRQDRSKWNAASVPTLYSELRNLLDAFHFTGHGKDKIAIDAIGDCRNVLCVQSRHALALAHTQDTSDDPHEPKCACPADETGDQHSTYCPREGMDFDPKTLYAEFQEWWKGYVCYEVDAKRIAEDAYIQGRADQSKLFAESSSEYQRGIAAAIEIVNYYIPRHIAQLIDDAAAPSFGVWQSDAVYVASRASIPERGRMWRQLRAEGFNITSTWIDEDGEGQTARFDDLWERITREIAASSKLVLYAELADLPLKGAFIEAGIALGMGKPVVVCLKDIPLSRNYRPIGSWITHPLVVRCDDIREAMHVRPAPPVTTTEVAGEDESK